MPELIKLCKETVPTAFDEVYKRYSKAMFNICLRMLVKREDAEDVLQESFISAFSKLEQYSGKVEFGAWLRSIVIRKCLDALRKNKLMEFLNQLPENIQDEQEQEVEPDYTVEDVYEGLKELSVGYRVVLNLFLFESLTHRQIADQLGISEGTSKSQYARGKKKLMEIISLKKESHAG